MKPPSQKQLAADVATNILQHSCLVMELDMRPVFRRLYGRHNWRLKLASLLVALAARILRVKHRFHDPSEN